MALRILVSTFSFLLGGSCIRFKFFFTVGIHVHYPHNYISSCIHLDSFCKNGWITQTKQALRNSPQELWKGISSMPCHWTSGRNGTYPKVRYWYEAPNIPWTCHWNGMVQIQLKINGIVWTEVHFSITMFEMDASLYVLQLVYIYTLSIFVLLFATYNTASRIVLVLQYLVRRRFNAHLASTCTASGGSS